MRMRTIEQAHAELLEADPSCALTKSAFRRLVVSGQIQSVRVGTKYLVDLDRLETFLFEDCETSQTPTGIRRVDVRPSGQALITERNQVAGR